MLVAAGEDVDIIFYLPAGACCCCCCCCCTSSSLAKSLSRNSICLLISSVWGLTSSRANIWSLTLVVSEEAIYMCCVPKKCLTLGLCLEYEPFIRGVPKKCLTLGLCLETFIRGVFCPNLFVCVCVFVCLYVRFFWKKQIIASGPLGQPVIFSNNIVHTININIHFQIKLKTSWAPKY